MVGYLHSPKTGALTYNLVHNWATALIVLGVGLWLRVVRGRRRRGRSSSRMSAWTGRSATA